MTLDLTTVVALTALSAFLMGASISLASHTQSTSAPSMASLGRGCLGQSLGWILVGICGQINSTILVFCGQLALLVSALCYLHAVNVFLDGAPQSDKRDATPWLKSALLVVCLPYCLALFAFTFAFPSEAARVIVIALTHGFLSTICAVRLLGARPLPFLQSRRIVGFGFALVALSHLFRIVIAGIDAPPTSDATALFSVLISPTGTLLFGHVAVVMLTFLFVLMVHDRAAHELRDLVTHDYLTGVFNRSAFEGFSRQAIEQALRSGDALSLLLLDVDHFKTINDTLGHPTGDVALCTLTDLTAQKLRSQDIFGRFGGEEFAVLLPATDALGAFLVAERIRESVAENEFHDGAHAFRMTISIGIAALSSRGDLSSAERLSALFRAADSALYQAKDAGRNRTIIAPAPASVARPVAVPPTVAPKVA